MEGGSGHSSPSELEGPELRNKRKRKKLTGWPVLRVCVTVVDPKVGRSQGEHPKSARSLRKQIQKVGRFFCHELERCHDFGKEHGGGATISGRKKHARSAAVRGFSLSSRPRTKCSGTIWGEEDAKSFAECPDVAPWFCILGRSIHEPSGMFLGEGTQ